VFVSFTYIFCPCKLIEYLPVDSCVSPSRSLLLACSSRARKHYSLRLIPIRCFLSELLLGLLKDLSICLSLSHGGKSRLKDWIIRVRDGKYTYGMNI
jgi:hypothetical protein